MTSAPFVVRKATEADVPGMHALIAELAEYERALDQMVLTVEQLRHDGFVVQPPRYGAWVAEMDGEIVGMALYYWRYSTWKGMRLYLEDIVVTLPKRGLGIGAVLFEKTIETAREAGATGMMWQVLDWNEPAIRFYEKMQTRFDKGWINCHLDF